MGNITLFFDLLSPHPHLQPWERELEELGWDKGGGVLRPVFSDMPIEPPQRDLGEHPHPASMPLQLQGGSEGSPVGPPTNSHVADMFLLGTEVASGAHSLTSPAIISAPGDSLSVHPDYKRQTRRVLQVGMGFRKPL